VPRRVIGRAAIAAMALVAIIAAWWFRPSPPGDAVRNSLELRALVDALSKEPNRPVEGRLAGGFGYAPLAVETRGESNRALSPDVRIATATVEKAAASTPSPRAHAAFGVALMLLGEWDRSVETLADAAAREPGNALLLNNLAVAHLARARAVDRPEDWVSGLAAANRAIALDPRSPEPHFNRALALRGMHLPFEESEAWSSYRQIDPGGAWSDEAVQHLSDRLQARREADERRKRPDNQALRERIEDDLLGRWGTAMAGNDSRLAAEPLAEAERLANDLAQAGGDEMPRDEIRRIRLAESSRSRALFDLAEGHRLFAEARARFLSDNLPEANRFMAEASTHLGKAGSHYHLWAPILQATILRLKGDAASGLTTLRTAAADGPVPPQYFHLRARLAWTEALLRELEGRWDRARDLAREAVAAYELARESENLIAARAVFAETEWFLGNRPAAWAALMATLADAERRGGSRRVEHLDLAASMALGAGFTEAALEFQAALGRIIQTPRSRVEIHIVRARTMLRLDDALGADAALARARAAMPGLGDPTHRDRMAAEIEAASAELLSRTDCDRSLPHSNAALAYYERSGASIRRVAALGVRAKCRAALGHADARTDLVDAIALLEARRRSVQAPNDRVQAFELERSVFKQLVAHDALRLQDEAAALESAEWERRGVVADAWVPRRDVRVNLDRLPANAAVIYYEVLDDRVLVWVLTAVRRELLSVSVGSRELTRMVTAISRAVAQGADLSALRPVSGGFFASLVEPALKLVSAPVIVIVPDGALHSIPFAALPDGDGRPLIATRTVVVAPSLATFVAASERLSTDWSRTVLAVGDGHDVDSTGLPRLPRADGEAARVAEMYAQSVLLTGGNATKARFMSSSDAGVVHFAGHSIVNERYPMLSRVLLAPNAAAGDSGWLLASEISAHRFRKTDVVVLASCEGAAGRLVDGEGAISLARAFFGAGVPAVVASLWPVDDDLQTLVMALHGGLKNGGDAALALRRAQLSLLEERGPRTPVRVWGGFVVLGGVRPGVKRQEAIRG
jgi:CHAT domain-containing protein